MDTYTMTHMVRLWKHVRDIEVIRNLTSIRYIIPLNTYGKDDKEILGKPLGILVKSDSVEISFEILPAFKSKNISNPDI